MPEAALAHAAPPETSLSRKLIRGAAIVIAAVALVFIVPAARNYIALVKSGKKIEARYAQLDERFQFAHTASDAVPSADRLTLALDARKKMISLLPADASATIDRFPARRDGGSTLQAFDALRIDPRWQAAILAHASALEAANMSFKEYRWLIWSLDMEAAKHIDRFPVGADFSNLSAKLTGMFMDFDAKSIKPPVIPGALVNRLAEGGSAALLFDLMVIDSSEGLP